jgi:primosomal protein N' (replication factor Y)
MSVDFRASERLFQLVTQVAGRAGRADVPGRVIVQSSATDMPALRFAMNHDYEGLAAAELPLRRKHGFPPFVRLTRFIVSGKRDLQTEEEAKALADRLRDTMTQIGVGGDVIGPQPCVVERIRNQYRHEILLRTRTAAQMTSILDAARRERTLRVKTAKLVVDVDPVSLS